MKTQLFMFCVFPGVLELKSVKSGHVAIKGQSTSLFLCMDSEGHLTGQVQQAKKTLNVKRMPSSCPWLTVHCASLVPFRVTTARLTAPSESCSWQTDTPVSSPRTTDLLCLWHQNTPRTDTQSPSLDSYRSGIPWQGRVCPNNHTTRDILTWTLMILLEWV